VMRLPLIATSQLGCTVPRCLPWAFFRARSARFCSLLCSPLHAQPVFFVAPSVSSFRVLSFSFISFSFCVNSHFPGSYRFSSIFKHLIDFLCKPSQICPQTRHACFDRFFCDQE
jgi:hypothetical protein